MKNKHNSSVAEAGYVFIIINFVLAVFNMLVGVVSGSIAIISDAVHSLIDSVTGFLVVISEKLSRFKRFSNKRNRIERITTVIIALIIIAAGIHLFVESITKIFVPEEVEYTVPTIIVLIASIITKYLLSNYLKDTSKETKSTVLAASSAETLNDTWISIAVLFSAIVYQISHLNIESYVSIAIAVLILKVGLEFIFPHLSHHHHHYLEQNPDHDHCGKSKP